MKIAQELSLNRISANRGLLAAGFGSELRNPLKFERKALEIEKGAQSIRTLKSVRRDIKWTGRGIKFYEGVVSLAGDASHLAQAAKNMGRGTKAAARFSKGFNGIAKIVLVCFTYVIIKEAIKTDRKNGDNRKFLGIPIGREARWAYGGEALSYTPYSSFFVTPLWEALRDYCDGRRQALLARGFNRSWPQNVTRSQKVDWIFANVL